MNKKIITILHACFSSADFIKKFSFFFLFEKILSRTSYCQTVLDPDQAQCFIGPDLGLHCLQRLSADDISRC